MAAVLLLAVSAPEPAEVQDFPDKTPRIAAVLAFVPELKILKRESQDGSEHSGNGVNSATGILEEHNVVWFLSGTNVVNATMTALPALDRFAIKRMSVFSDIVGGVGSSLGIGDVAGAER